MQQGPWVFWPIWMVLQVRAQVHQHAVLQMIIPPIIIAAQQEIITTIISLQPYSVQQHSNTNIKFYSLMPFPMASGFAGHWPLPLPPALPCFFLLTKRNKCTFSMTHTHNSKSFDSFTNDITYYSPTDLNRSIWSKKRNQTWIAQHHWYKIPTNNTKSILTWYLITQVPGSSSSTKDNTWHSSQ